MAEKRLAVVTGAARGIGRAIVFELLKQGRIVAGLDINAEQLGELDNLVKEAGFTIVTKCVDITSTEQFTQTLESLASDYGGIGILVNNAGITRDNLLIRMSDEEFDKVLAVNLRAARSPTVSWKLIEEITSLQSAVERSRNGAGIPSRKDFFEFHGKEPVKYAEHLTWHDLLKFSGARGRRRDRTICSAIHVSAVSECIFGQLMRCLSAAETFRDESLITKIATDSVKTIIEHVVQEMKQAREGSKEHEHCVLCPHCEECTRVFKNA